MRILHIMGGANAGGIAAVVLNYMTHLDQNKFHFDIALTGHKPGMLGEKMMALGATFYELPLKSQGLNAYEDALSDLLEREHFDAVHVHENSTSYVALRVAKKHGVPCRIAHAHTSGYYTTLHGFLTVFSGRILNYHYATKIVGCGKLAGDRIFGVRHMKMRKAQVLPNAIETEHFKFNPEARIRLRRELNLGDTYTIGLIGRFSPQKNQPFALRVIRQLHQQNPNFLFLLVGVGETMDEMSAYCHDNQMDGYVTFLGTRSDITDIYQALDVCIMPSLYEGFPVAGVEALASGLPLLLSDQITSELNFSARAKYLPLKESFWVEELLKKPQNPRRENGYLEVRENGFDIRDTSSILERIYRESEH